MPTPYGRLCGWLPRDPGTNRIVVWGARGTWYPGPLAPHLWCLFLGAFLAMGLQFLLTESTVNARSRKRRKGKGPDTYPLGSVTGTSLSHDTKETLQTRTEHSPVI